MREGNIRKVKLHLKAGMNPDTVDKHGLLYRGYRNTPVLLYAAHWGSPEIALALIKAGADVTVRDRNEMTPLMHAVLRDEPELVKALIEAGADVNASVRNNMTVLVYAVLARRIDPEDAFTGLLMDAVTGLNAELHGGGRRRGASPSPNDTDIQDSTECLKLLLEAGVDIDAQTGHGETALMYAARTGRFEKAQLLLEYGADPNVTNVQGETALDMAKKGRHGEILKLLKQVDAKK
jgi:ankyrin repeat protein